MTTSAARTLPVLMSFVATLAIACGPAADSGPDDAGAGGPAGTPARTAADGGTVLLYTADRYEGVFELDPDTLEVIGHIDTGPRPHGLVASPDGRLLYVTLEATNEVIKVDAATNEIIGRGSVGPVPNEPTISHDGRYLFVPQRGADGCDIFDTEAMAVVKTLNCGAQGHNAYISADGERVYSTSMGEDLIAVIDVASQEIIRKVPMGGVPRPVALTDDESVAYVALSGLLGFAVWDLTLDEIVDRVEMPIPEGTPPPPLDTYTHGLLLTPNQREVWVAGYAVGKVYGYMVPELQQIAAIDVGGQPHWLTLHPGGEPLYVSLEQEGAVAAIHRGIREVMRTMPVGEAPTRILAFRSPVARE